MVSEIDFEGLAAELLSQIRNLLPVWLPGGKIKGNEYECGDILGGQGDSLRVNINTGRWCDFATDEKGGDLIALYAAINGLKQGEAAKQLAEETALKTKTKNHIQNPKPPEVKEPTPIFPPKDAKPPNMKHGSLGNPSGSWCYRSPEGDPIFYVARYESKDGKQILPYSWVDDGWKCKGWPPPRPLYGLPQIKERPERAILVVEGEKCADAAKKIVGKVYSVMTWPNGSKAVAKVDWNPIYGLPILLWPDADKAGNEAMNQIAGILEENCPQIKYLNVDDMPDGWDAADALADGWDWTRMKIWAAPIVKVWGETTEIVEVEAEVEPIEEESDDPARLSIETEGPTKISVSINDADMEILNGSFTHIHEKLGIPLTANKTPICNIDACHRVIGAVPEFKNIAWYDEFYQRVYTEWGGKGVRQWKTFDTIDLVLFMQNRLGMRRVSKEMVETAIAYYAQKHPRNVIKEWMNSLKWDGRPRLEQFFQSCFNTADSPYVRAIGKKFFICLVARIFEPGCQVDTMVVLEGAQGVGKSTALGIIAGGLHSVAKGSLDSKDFFLALEGKMICEVSELESFNKAAVTLIKQVITCRTDRYRTPYEDRAQDHPRQSVFVATTNNTQWQRDETGARRFWPITCKTVNLDKVRENKDQLFAEAVHRYKAGEDWHKTPEKSTKEEQEARRQVDAWESVVEDYLLRPGAPESVTVTDIAVNCLKIEVSKLDMRIQRRIGVVLSTLGWDRKSERLDGRTQKVWKQKEKKDNEQELEDLQED